MRQSLLSFFLILFSVTQLGCARLFGWDIHAPGILSQGYYQKVTPLHERIALYFSPDLLTGISTNRGGRLADPQKYHIGESLGPMLIEAFQGGFAEFVFMEVDPTAQILKQYAIPYLVVVRIKDFDNQVSWHGQGVSLVTEAVVLDSDLKFLAKFESRGTSDAQKVFAKKGGPEVNLNAALENNVLVTVQYLQDSIRRGSWQGNQNP